MRAGNQFILLKGARLLTHGLSADGVTDFTIKLLPKFPNYIIVVKKNFILHVSPMSKIFITCYFNKIFICYRIDMEK